MARNICELKQLLVAQVPSNSCNFVGKSLKIFKFISIFLGVRVPYF